MSAVRPRALSTADAGSTVVDGTRTVTGGVRTGQVAVTRAVLA